LKKIHCGTMQILSSIQQEIQILSQLENEFIISYEDHFHDDSYFFILTEYCQVKKKIFYILYFIYLDFENKIFFFN